MINFCRPIISSFANTKQVPQLIMCMGPNFLRCTKIFSQCHFFLFFLPSHFLPCKDTFMDDYDRIQNCNGLKCNHSKVFEHFWLIIFYGDQNIGLKRIEVRTKPFSSCSTPQRIFTHISKFTMDKLGSPPWFHNVWIYGVKVIHY